MIPASPTNRVNVSLLYGETVSGYLHAKSFDNGVERLLVRAMKSTVTVSVFFGTAVVFHRGGTS